MTTPLDIIFGNDDIRYFDNLVRHYIDLFKTKKVGENHLIVLDKTQVSHHVVRNFSFNMIKRQAEYLKRHIKSYELHVKNTENKIYGSWNVIETKKYFITKREKEYLDKLIKEYVNYFIGNPSSKVLYATLCKTEWDPDNNQDVINSLKMRANCIRQAIEDD